MITSFPSFLQNDASFSSSIHHFDQNGKTLDQYPPDFWFALKPSMIEITAKPGVLLTYQNLQNHLKIFCLMRMLTCMSLAINENSVGKKNN